MKDFEKWMERILDASSMVDAGRALISFSYAATAQGAQQKYTDLFLMYILERFSAYDRDSRFYIAESGVIVATSILSRIRFDELASNNRDIIRNLGAQFIFEFEQTKGCQMSAVEVWMVLNEFDEKYGLFEKINVDRKTMLLLFRNDHRKESWSKVFCKEYPDGSRGWQIELFPTPRDSSKEIGERLSSLFATIIAKEVFQTWRDTQVYPAWLYTSLRRCGVEPEPAQLDEQIRRVLSLALLIDSRFAGPGIQIKLKELGFERTAGYMGFLGVALKFIKENHRDVCKDGEGASYDGQ